MNLTYKEFLKLLSENTREYIENVMNELYYYERLSTTSDNNRYFNIIRACYIGMEKDIAYTDFIKKMKFDSSNIDNSSKSRIYYDFKKFLLRLRKKYLENIIVFSFCRIVLKTLSTFNI